MWKCVPGCSECCVCYHMPLPFVKRYTTRAQVPILQIEVVGDTAKPVTADGKCFMLNRQTGKCMSYKDRPHICHLYGKHSRMLCAYVDKAGKIRPIQEVMNIKAHQEIANVLMTTTILK